MKLAERRNIGSRGEGVIERWDTYFMDLYWDIQFIFFLFKKIYFLESKKKNLKKIKITFLIKKI